MENAAKPLQFLTAAILFLSVECSPNKCATLLSKAEQAGPLPAGIKFPTSYKVSAVFTDWKKNETSLLTEVRKDTSFGLQVTKRSLQERWVRIDNSTVHLFDSKCAVSMPNDSQPITLPSAFSSVMTNQSSSIFHFMSVFLGKNFTGSIVGTQVEAGVAGVEWMSCHKEENVGMQVIYSGELSIEPPSSAFSNPLIYGITFSHFTNISDANSTSDAHVSLTFFQLEEANADNSLFKTEDGLICDGLPPCELPLKILSTFTATVTDGNMGGSESTTTVTFDTGRNVTTEYLLSSGKALVFGEEVAPDATNLVHHFSDGLEYVITPQSCMLRGLPNNTQDVKDGKMTSPSSLFLPPSITYSFYQKGQHHGSSVSIYRGRQSVNNTIDVHIDHNGVLRGIYFYNSSSLSSWRRFIFSPVVNTVPLLSQIHDCYNTSQNSSFSILVPGKSVSDVERIGSDYVTESFSQAFAVLSGAGMSSHRFWFLFTGQESGNGLLVVFIVSDPAELPFLPKEKTVSDFIAAFNETISQKSWVINVTDSSGKAEAWEVLSGSLSKFPNLPAPSPPTPSFNGYTGGAMFVLALFMLMLGVVVGTGGVFYFTRRQHISSLAYQVFE